MFKQSRFSLTFRVAFSLLLLFLCAFSIIAQEGTGTLRGAISDPGGAVIPGALVSVAKPNRTLQLGFRIAF